MNKIVITYNGSYRRNSTCFILVDKYAILNAIEELYTKIKHEL
jgi:hypothetical protein